MEYLIQLTSFPTNQRSDGAGLVWHLKSQLRVDVVARFARRLAEVYSMYPSSTRDEMNRGNTDMALASSFGTGTQSDEGSLECV